MTDEPYHVEQARKKNNEALNDALAIARGTTHAAPEEFARLQALARDRQEILDALAWLEDVVSSMPDHLYDQTGVHGAVLNARRVMHEAGELTASDEEQANLVRDITREFVDEENPVSLQEEIDRS